MTRPTSILSFSLTLLSLYSLLPSTLALPAPGPAVAIAPLAARDADFASDFAAVLAAASREADFAEEGENAGMGIGARDAAPEAAPLAPGRASNRKKDQTVEQMMRNFYSQRFGVGQ